jgi:NADH:ubiquinone oxidoreductase subunit F (NADH-binding)
MAGMDQGLRQALNLGREETIAEVVRAGLRDRDYENLPTGGRIKCHAALCGDDKLIVCDCVDIEPGVQIYRHLLAASAAEVVEGALIVAFATGSRRVVVHVAEDDEHGAAAVAAAAQQLCADAGPRGCRRQPGCHTRWRSRWYGLCSDAT